MYFVCTCALHSGQCYKWVFKNSEIDDDKYTQSKYSYSSSNSNFCCLCKQTAVCAHIQKNVLQVFKWCERGFFLRQNNYYLGIGILFLFFAITRKIGA